MVTEGIDKTGIIVYIVRTFTSFQHIIFRPLTMLSWTMYYSVQLLVDQLAGKHNTKTKDIQSDNSWVSMDYNETVRGQNRTNKAYGQIIRIFLHRLVSTTEQECILEVKWYDRDNLNRVDPISGLTVVKLSHHQDLHCKFVFLKNMWALNCVLWPLVVGRVIVENTKVVIIHHNTLGD